MTERRHERLGLHDEDLAEMLYRLRLTRAMDERFIQLNRQGKVLAFASCQGQEAAQIGGTYALAPEDWIALCYREHGVAITRGMPLRDIFAFGFRRDADPNTKGRLMAGHYSDPRLRILSASSPVGTQLLHGVGSAWASHYLGLREATIIFHGDGATSTGDAHAALNFAAIHKLPAVFFCQNNGWAISVANDAQYAAESLAKRAAGYGMCGVEVDGTDVLSVYETTRDALARAHAGDGPTFLEARMRRLGSHTTEDDQRRYRGKEAIEADRTFDPLPKFDAYLKAAGLWDEGMARQIDERVRAEIEDAQQYAEELPSPTPEAALEHVYSSDNH